MPKEHREPPWPPWNAPFLNRSFEQSARVPFEQRERELNEYGLTQRVEGDVIVIEDLKDV